MQKVLVTIKTMIKNVMKKEPVLSIAVILAVISMFVVHPDDTYAKSVKQSEKYFWYCHDSRTSLLLLINGDYK